ncbi:hypothetical protein COO60DRAFT_1461006 [Scenedesmus sp. NREL 46B-D3]|nr:hypothetical protein COO60DRAFT_1461006 [Scenedesmus sp. NREL 46B-D3]
MQVPAMVRRITNDIRSATTIQEVEAIFSVWQTYSFFDSIHTAATFTRVANLLKGRPASTTAAAKTLLDQLAAAWDTQLQQATVQGLANFLWASGRLRYANPQLWSRTLQLFCRQQQGEATCQEVSNVVYSWQCWQKQTAVKFLAEAVAVMATAPMHSVAGRDISNVLWAHARLGVQVPAAWQRALLQSMVRESVLSGATSQALVNVLYAVVHLQQLLGWEPAAGNAQLWQTQDSHSVQQKQGQLQCSCCKVA